MVQRFACDGGHYVVNDRLFVVVGTRPPLSFPHHIPPLQAVDLVSYDDSRCVLTHPNWITAKSPYLAFLPSFDVFGHHWFTSLRYSADIEIDHLSNGHFRLGKSVVKQWDMQERNMRKLLNAAVHNNPDLCLPPPYTPWPYPRQYGYTKSYPSLEIVHRQAKATHGAFVLLVATINFTIHLMIRRMKLVALAKGRDLDRHEWIHVLKVESKLPGTWISYWIDNVVDSPVFGGYIDMYTFGRSNFLSFFEEAGIPLVLHFGHHPECISVPKSLKNRPQLQLYCRLLREQLSFDETVQCTRSVRASALMDPALNSRSDDSIEEFVVCRRVRSGQSLSIEHASDREKRLFQQQTISRKAFLDAEHVRRREWCDGRLVCQEMGRKCASNACTSCRFCEPRIGTDLDERDRWAFFKDNGSEDAEPSHAVVHKIQLFPDKDCADEPERHSFVSTVFPNDLNVVIHDSVAFVDTVEDVVYNRFGFVDPAEDVDLHRNMPWQKIERMLGCGGESTGKPSLLSKRTKGTISHFLEALMNAGTLNEAPHTLDLLDRQNCIHTDWQLELRFLNVGNGYYLLDEPRGIGSTTVAFSLAIESGATVLEIVRRRWGPGLRAVMESLMQAGICFRTFVLSDRHLKPYKVEPEMSSRSRLAIDTSRLKPCVSLGYRDHQHRFDLEDYAVYVRERDAFLRTYRGRAAVMMGGIISRLARNAAIPADVLNGPALDVDREWGVGECFYRGYGNDAYWDDSLTEEEVNLVCGVYEVGKAPDTNGYVALTQKSWWPKPAAWNASGLNCGYWSQDAEYWFQNRLRRIQSGQDNVLMTKQEWRGNIKFTKDAVRLRERYDRLAKEYLDRRLLR
ncbi:hypothetical protein V5O48_003023 [Marasmius crinis-equi]|uniref:Uncharacterized protein n=1 Tax=Marasmius crinis-equi TaxID=585013 RepID=A0ABR3FU16_9AGAR